MAEAVLANGEVGLENGDDNRRSQHATTAGEAPDDVSPTQSAASGERRTLTDVEVAARVGVSPFVERERRSFSLLRPITDTDAQERIRDLVLQAYVEYEHETAEAVS